MPGVVAHWAVARRLRSFIEGDDECRESLLTGAIAPDVGFYPGAASEISYLSHHVRTGALTADLLRSARSAAEAAFATGWYSHYLADVLVHPLVNAETGSLPAEDMRAHVRVEGGIDAYLYAYERPPVSGLSARHSAFLSAAFARTYGRHFPVALFDESFRAAQGNVRRLWSLAALQAASWRLSPVPAASLRDAVTSFIPLKLAVALRGEAAVRHGEFGSLVRPRAEVVAACRKALGEVVSRTDTLDQTEDVPDVDLDTGRSIR